MVQQALTFAIELTLAFAFIGIPALMINDLILGFRKYRKTAITIDPNQYDSPAGPAEPHHYEPAGPKTMAESIEDCNVKQLKGIAKKLKLTGYSKLKKTQLKQTIQDNLKPKKPKLELIKTAKKAA